MGWGYACCPTCGEPLISTMAFSQAEFYCLPCGRSFGFLQPIGKPDDTPGLQERHDELRARWDEHAGPYLLYGWRTDCAQCEPRREYHHEHATEEELMAHAAAMKWLEDQRGVRT